jgi:hypothetical protein
VCGLRVVPHRDGDDDDAEADAEHDRRRDHEAGWLSGSSKRRARSRTRPSLARTRRNIPGHQRTARVVEVERARRRFKAAMEAPHSRRPHGSSRLLPDGGHVSIVKGGASR